MLAVPEMPKPDSPIIGPWLENNRILVADPDNIAARQFSSVTGDLANDLRAASKFRSVRDHLDQLNAENVESLESELAVVQDEVDDLEEAAKNIQAKLDVANGAKKQILDVAVYSVRSVKCGLGSAAVAGGC